jgi:HEAT repeat protein
MNRRWKYLLAALITIAIALAFLQSRGKPEPVYKGVRISRRIELDSRGDTLQAALAEIGPESIPYLRRALHAHNSPLKRAQLAIWAKLPRSTQRKYLAHVPVDAQTIRQNALWGLRSWGPEAKEALPELIQIALHGTNLWSHELALSAVVEVGQHSPETLAVLHHELASGDKVRRSQAAVMICNSGLKDTAALPWLVQALKEYQPGQAGNLQPVNEMLALEEMGAEAEAAVPFLINAFCEPQVTGNALTALIGIGPGAHDAVPALISAWRQGDRRAGIVTALGNVGPAAKAAFPLLTEALEEKDPVIQVLAAVAIGKIQGTPESAVPALIQVLKNKSNEHLKEHLTLRMPDPIGLGHRESAAWFLGEIGPPAQDALPSLHEALSSKQIWLPVFAARAIWKIDHHAEAVLPTLLNLLKSGDSITRVLAIRALADIGPGAKPAVPALLEARKVSLPVRRAVNEALKKIDPETASKVMYKPTH